MFNPITPSSRLFLAAYRGDRQMRIAVGASRDVGERFTVGVQLEYEDLFSNNIDRQSALQGKLQGDYSPSFGLIGSITVAVR